MKTKIEILEFIKRHQVCVLATSSKTGKPEAAAIEFAETDNFELIFDTFSTYRKYPNLKANPNVAVVIGWEDATVQYEGVATEVDGEEMEELKNIFVKKNPGASKFFDIPETRYFKVTPEWLRYRDYSTTPETLIELTEF
ncbi:MAG: pyridoxamine 5'-phosphate oxidase family protein [Candidatus Berkelbacteria bacterium]|nr:MAG: pyridoxamine 5'-phosphate oxidase family protein [Candidatus Berkelbacteria bacterium]QQG51436.1 MAG: pyridoxamine 5'-phosphate oxidase family protein [Candidatus Berkelbacteria bacterium]